MISIGVCLRKMHKSIDFLFPFDCKYIIHCKNRHIIVYLYCNITLHLEIVKLSF